MQNIPFVRLIVVFSTVFSSVYCSQVLLDNNGYDNIVVAIPTDITQRQTEGIDAQTFITNLQNIFISASRELYTASRYRSYFKTINIILPSTWINNFTEVEPAESWMTYETADFRIVVDDSYVTSTHQSKPCGMGGEYISIPDYFVSNEAEAIAAVGPREKAIVHEWAHYRWGVFEEYGYPSSTYYPYFYTNANGRIVPTGCYNQQEIEGEFGYSEDWKAPNDEVCWYPFTEDPQCRFYPSFQNTTTSTSYMYMQYLPSVTDFCDPDTHNVDAPNKQNLLCGYRSVWEVMSNHVDFIDGANAANPGLPAIPKFNYYSPVTSGIYFLLDISKLSASTINSSVPPEYTPYDANNTVEEFRIVADTDINASSYLAINSAFFQSFDVIIWSQSHVEQTLYRTTINSAISSNLKSSSPPGNTYFGLAYFSGTPVEGNTYLQEQLPLQSWTTAQSSFYGYLTSVPTSTSSNVDVSAAIYEAIGKLTTFSAAGSSIYITKYGSMTSALYSESIVSSVLNSNKIRLITVEVGDTTQSQADGAFVNLMDKTTGQGYFINSDGAIESTIETTVTSLLTQPNSTSWYSYSTKQLALNAVNILSGSSYNGFVEVDSSIGINTKVSFQYLASLQNSLTFSVTGNGKTVTDYTRQTAWNIQNDDSIRIYSVPDMTAKATWNYSITSTAPTDTDVIIDVRSGIQTSSTSSPTIDIKTWSNGIQNGRIFSLNMRDTDPYVVVLTQVEYNSMPMVNAIVYATVQMPNGTTVEYQMLDNGQQEPDMVKNDGIYSVYYIPPAESNGLYTVSITVISLSPTPNKAVVTKSSVLPIDQQNYCCSENTYIQTVISTSTNIQRHIQDAVILNVTNAMGLEKPKQVVDFTVTIVDTDNETTPWYNTLYCNFTAPGTLVTNEKVSALYLWQAPSQSEVLSPDPYTTMYYQIPPDSIPNPGEGGLFIFSINSSFYENQTYYFNMVARNIIIDSDPSSVAKVSIPGMYEDSTLAPLTTRGTSSGTTKPTTRRPTTKASGTSRIPNPPTRKPPPTTKKPRDTSGNDSGSTHRAIMALVLTNVIMYVLLS